MSSKLITGPIVLRAASLTLAAASAFTNVVGTADSDNANATSGAVALGSASMVRFQGTYTRAGGSAPGRPTSRSTCRWTLRRRPRGASGGSSRCTCSTAGASRWA